MGYYILMDSVKRGPDGAFQKTISPLEQNPPASRLSYKEELFISPGDVQRMEEHEKKFRKGRLIKKIVWLAAGLIVLAIISYAIYFSWKAYAISKKMNSESQVQQTNLMQYARAIISPIIPAKRNPLKGEQDGRINILLLGAAGQHQPGGNLTDTIMVMSIDTKNKKVAMLSLPRDLYVQIPDSQSYTKINSLYPIGIKQDAGVDLIKSAVSKITGINIDYYFAIDFDGFKKVIDDIGGVNVISERDIYDARYPGPNYSYETFSLSKGFHKLDGATTLKYVRERHNDPEGDFGRAKRQQQVIQAVKNKLFSAATFFNVVALNNILDTLGESIKTDIAFEDIDSFIKLSKEVDMQNITNVVADAWQKDSLLKVSHVTLGNTMAFILVPRVGNYSEIQDLAKNIFDLTELKKRQDAIAQEKASLAIINQSGDSQLAYKIQKLLEDKLSIDNVNIIQQKSGSSIAAQTTVSDTSNGTKLFTLDELIKKIPASLSSQASTVADSSKYDIVLTLGSDIVDIYKYEDNTMQDLENAENDQADLNITNNN
jgi:polyisoprenyl-teichoic acid--peptidoglycan teichoic acid transferase